MLLTDYLDRARIHSGLGSDNKLSFVLEVSQPSVSLWRRGLAIPTPAKMVKLAGLAGVSPEVALLHRASWQADDQVSRAVMSRLISSWMEAPSDNTLTGAKSLGAAAAPSVPKAARLRYIMERTAALVARVFIGLGEPATQRQRFTLSPG
jgi:hypothetical protein